MLLTSASAFADVPNYNMEVGLLGGVSYCMGEVSSYAFQSSTGAYGVQFRYKFTPRIALQAKVQSTPVYAQWDFFNFDVTAEYNFFRFGLNYYDSRVEYFTPYIFLGVGMSMSNFEALTTKNGFKDKSFRGAYLPVGIGLKWKFAERWQLQAAWQHQIYVDPIKGDDIDNSASANYNILNNDVVSTLTASIVFEFAQEKKRCVMCKD
jgi:hypothetical protein